MYLNVLKEMFYVHCLQIIAPNSSSMHCPATGVWGREHVCSLFSWPMQSLLPVLIVAHSDWLFDLRSQVHFSSFLFPLLPSVTLSLAHTPNFILFVYLFISFLAPWNSQNFLLLWTCNCPSCCFSYTAANCCWAPHVAPRWPSEHISDFSPDVL